MGQDSAGWWDTIAHFTGEGDSQLIVHTFRVISEADPETKKPLICETQETPWEAEETSQGKEDSEYRVIILRSLLCV